MPRTCRPSSGPLPSPSRREPARGFGARWPRWRPSLGALLVAGPLGVFGAILPAHAQTSPTDLYVGPARSSIDAALEPSNAPEVVSIAHGRGGYLAVWAQSDDVRGARIAEDGTVLDPMGITIARSQIVGDLAVSFDGTNYLVAWSANVWNFDARIEAARVGVDGSILDATPRVLARDVRVSRLGLARGGLRQLLVWTQLDAAAGEWDVYGVRVGSNGAALEAAPFPIAAGPGHQSDAAVTFDGTNYVVAWSNQASDADFGQNDIRAARVSRAGVVLDPAGITVFDGAGYQHAPRLAFDGSSTVIAWTSAPTDPGDDRAARLAPDGTVLDPAGFVLAPGHHSLLALERDGNRSLALRINSVDSTRHQLNVLPINPDGVVDGANVWTVGDPVTTFGDATMSVGSTHVLVVHKSESHGVPLVTAYPRGTTVASASAALNWASTTQDAPLLSFGADHHLQLWAETGRAGTVLRATRLERDGTVVDASGIDVGSLSSADDRGAVAFDGTNHLVVWAGPTVDGTRVHAMRIGADGNVVDPQPLVIAELPDWYPEAQQPRVAFDGTSYLVVWRKVESFDGEGWSYLRGARIAPDLSLLDPSVLAIETIDVSLAGAIEADVVAHGAGFLVVHSGSSSDPQGLTLRRIRADGTPLDPVGLDVPTLGRPADRLRLVSDGTQALLTWRSWAFGDVRLYAIRIGPDGQLLDDCPIVVERGVSNVSVASIAIVDDHYLIAFARAQAPVTYGVYVARVDRNGQRIGPNRELVPTAQDVGQNITLSVDDVGDVLLGTIDDASTYLLRSRVVLRSLSCVVPSKPVCGTGVAAPVSSDPEPLVCGEPPRPPSTGGSSSSTCSLGHGSGDSFTLVGLAGLCVLTAWRRRSTVHGPVRQKGRARASWAPR